MDPEKFKEYIIDQNMTGSEALKKRTDEIAHELRENFEKYVERIDAKGLQLSREHAFQTWVIWKLASIQAQNEGRQMMIDNELNTLKKS